MDVSHIAKLANLRLSVEQEKSFTSEFEHTLQVVEQMNELDTTDVEPTAQVTGLITVLRPDKIDRSRILSVEMALSQAKNRQGDYFVVPAVLDQS